MNKNKTKRIHFRVSEKDFEEIKKLADQFADGNISKFILLKCLQKAEKVKSL